jgi:hypothetical protein
VKIQLLEGEPSAVSAHMKKLEAQPMDS